MTILCLDLGSRCGWAADRDGTPESGVQFFTPARHEGGGMRYLRFKRWLSVMAECLTPLEAIYYEEVRRHVGVDAAHAYGGFLAHLSAWCERDGIPYLGVPVATIKRHITAHGAAPKARVIKAVNERYGTDTTDDNEADALALLAWVQDTRGGVL